MVFEHIEKLKQQFTDQYVRVESDRPELARFQGVVGQVKTVNFSGRALVEFLDYHLNTGWHDIDVDFLKVVNRPQPKEPEKKAAMAAPVAKKAAKPTDGKKLSPLEMARMQGAVKSGGSAPKEKQSIEEVLAAARTPKRPVADVLAAARQPKGGTATDSPAKAAPSKPKPGARMSVADMIAAARGENKSGDDTPAAQVTATADEPETTDNQPAAAPSSAAVSGKVDRQAMSVDEMIAYCREHDAA